MDILLLAAQEENMNIFFFLYQVANFHFLQMNQVTNPDKASPV